MEAFDVLGDPVRRSILELLGETELSAGAIGETVQEMYGISQPAVSQHLRVLRESGFVTARPEGTRRLYAVQPDGLRNVDAWLDQFRRFWTPKLDALGTELARGKWGPAFRDSEDDDSKEREVIDVVEQINAVTRRVGAHTLEGGESRTVTISQTYDTDIADLWDAVTNPERIPRWFLPVSGVLSVGGRYQLEGNAGGTVRECEPPHRFEATWEFGDSVTSIEVTLTTEPGDRTRFALAHTVGVDDQWAEFGPGAVGVGWDLSLGGLSLHLASGDAVDAAAFMAWSGSDEGKQFVTQSSESWRHANVAGGAGVTEARSQAEATTAAYTAGQDPA